MGGFDGRGSLLTQFSAKMRFSQNSAYMVTRAYSKSSLAWMGPILGQTEASQTTMSPLSLDLYLRRSASITPE